MIPIYAALGFLLSLLAMLLPNGSSAADGTHPDKAPSNTSGWLTYTDTKYGFSIKYPHGTAIETSDYGSLHPFANPPVAHLFVQNNSTQTEGYVTINISTDNADIAHCTDEPTESYYDKNTEMVLTREQNISMNSIIFHQSHFGGFQYPDLGGGSINGFRLQYKTVHNGMCYNIEVSSFAGACISAICIGDRRWSLKSEAAVLRRLASIVQTFRFNN